MVRLGVSAPRGVVITLTVLCLEAVVLADGGVLRARHATGPFVVSVFTAPEPLRVGPVEVSVIVESSGGGVLTDAVVDLLFESGTRGIDPRRARATHDGASIGLAQAAVVDLPSAGEWTLTISVRSGAGAASTTCLLPVAPAASRLGTIWPWLLVPPIGILLFAVHQTLKQRRRTWGPSSPYIRSG
jgi:hypothetical protein